MNIKEKVTERLIRYAKIDTQSDDSKTTTPTTEGQLVLAKLLVEELQSIGLVDVSLDENGYVMATLPSNANKEVPTIGFLAHVDTATDFTGKNVQPQIIKNYAGSDITLNDELDIRMPTAEYPELLQYVGEDLVMTDGTTLLGADNKAGIAEIMTALEYLIAHPEIEHGKIRVAFTPDEEIGRGPHKFNVEQFNAEFAYTVDGGPVGELQYESFNAAAAKIRITGNNVHPGTAKGKLVHSVKIANELMDRLPAEAAPEHTENYEGFYHLISINGTVETTELYYIIRDFSKEEFTKKKQAIQQIGRELNEKYGPDTVIMEITDQYYNMAEKIVPVMEIVDIAERAMNNLGITPIIRPVRGGTDGSQLSFMGLPTPNIFTGGENFHGKYEFISVQSMEKAVKTIIEIARLFAEQSE